MQLHSSSKKETGGSERQKFSHDSPEGLSLVKQTLIALQELKDELDGAAETKVDMDAMRKIMRDLRRTLQNAHAEKYSFSEMRIEHLRDLGLDFRFMAIDYSVLDRLVEGVDFKAFRVRIPTLRAHLQDIYDSSVDLDCDNKTQMVVSAILLCLRDLNCSSEFDVAIHSDYDITPPEGVEVRHKDNDYTLSISGSVDYAVVKRYRVDDSNGERPTPSGSEDPLLPDGIANRFFVTEMKPWKSNGECAEINMDLELRAKPISQALASATLEKKNQVRFCFTAGKYWIFLILKREHEDEPWAVYTSSTEDIGYQSYVEGFQVVERRLTRLLVLLSEWLKDSPADGICILDPFLKR